MPYQEEEYDAFLKLRYRSGATFANIPSSSYHFPHRFQALDATAT